jgi:hypothetical protein
MLMVVFGAGASYDSYPSIRPPTDFLLPGLRSHSENERPPLASQLFSDRDAFVKVASDFPDCQPIIPFVRHAPKHSSVEQVLEVLQSEAKQNHRRYVQLAAVRHYLQFIILECEGKWRSVHKGITNYLTLLDEIESLRKQNEPVCLVTFNYDTMLEQALPAVGVKIAEMEDYVTQHYRLIKLHGSVSWGRQVVSPMNMKVMNEWAVANELIKNAKDLRMTDEYRMVTSRPIGKSDELPLIPALAIPVVNKQEYECPKLHLEVLDSCLPQITKLLVVGWRASETHFLQRLAKGLKHDLQVMVVSGSPAAAEETINNLAVARMRVIGGYQKAEAGFSDFIVGRAVQGFLTS